MKPGLKWSLIVGGGLTVLGPVSGVFWSTLELLAFFREADESGPMSPDAVASGVASAMPPSLVGIAVGAIGFIVFLIALVRVLAEKKQNQPLKR